MDAQRNPTEYGFDKVSREAAAAHAEEAAKEAASSLHIKPRHLFVRAANHLYDHPFQMIAGLSLPVIGGIFYQELQKPGELHGGRGRSKCGCGW